ncbi:MAG TPA: EAL domain-containing protein [Xanthobacteraceae bacterium]|jgi:cyclic-di-GMP phosphodiesterase TipF (flagellum assembly factor)|nr:EAL domain-containing protein [Xanthobacteraceae bacterium]
MVRISAFLIAACMVLIAALLGAAVYARFGFTGAESALAGLGALTAFAVYYAVAARRHDRLESSNQLARLARGAGDLASQLGEFGRRLNAMESKLESAVERAVASSQPFTEEVERLSNAVKTLSGSVAAHEAALGDHASKHQFEVEDLPGIVGVERLANAPVIARLQFAPSASRPVPTNGKTAPFAGFDRDAVAGALRKAVDTGEIELHLQPVVALPQRKLRYYEALARVKTDGGELVAAGEFLSDAEAAALMPKIDYLAAARSVQIVRRLLLQKREVGLFCNLAPATLADPGFSKFLELMDANRAIAAALVFEFAQSAVRAMGTIEHASLAALAERGFRFSMDNLTDLRVNAHELNERGFRFVKVPAPLLFNRLGTLTADIRPADFSESLGRFGIDLIADRIEHENTVIDLLDYDVRFGQGVLFSPPRPLRAGALESVDAKANEQNATNGAEAAPAASFTPLVRAGMGHS